MRGKAARRPSAGLSRDEIKEWLRGAGMVGGPDGITALHCPTCACRQKRVYATSAERQRAAYRRRKKSVQEASAR